MWRKRTEKRYVAPFTRDSPLIVVMAIISVHPMPNVKPVNYSFNPCDTRDGVGLVGDMGSTTKTDTNKNRWNQSGTDCGIDMSWSTKILLFNDFECTIQGCDHFMHRGQDWIFANRCFDTLPIGWLFWKSGKELVEIVIYTSRNGKILPRRKEHG